MMQSEVDLACSPIPREHFKGWSAVSMTFHTQPPSSLRVSIFSKIPVFPPHGGNRSRLKSLCTALKDRGCDVRFYLIPSQQMRDYDEAAHHVFFGTERVHLLQRSRLAFLIFATKVAWLRVMTRLNVLPRQSRNPDYLCSRSFGTQVRVASRQHPADIAFVEYVHFSRLLDEIPSSTFKVLDTHDSFHNEFTSEAEAKGFLRADKVLAIQDEEAALFRSYLGPESHRVMVQSHILPLEGVVDVTETQGATFLGSSFEANVTSLRFFIDDILPLVLKQRPTFKLYVAGSVCDDVEGTHAVIKLGRVPTVADAFRAAPLLINSIRAGTGVKIKLLEAMSHGVPVISTTTGLQGLITACRGGVVEIADQDAAGFASAVVALYDDSARRIELGALARRSSLIWNDDQQKRLGLLLTEARAHLDAKPAFGAKTYRCDARPLCE